MIAVGGGCIPNREEASRPASIIPCAEEGSPWSDGIQTLSTTSKATVEQPFREWAGLSGGRLLFFASLVTSLAFPAPKYTVIRAN
jgi:hypothetical protein